MPRKQQFSNKQKKLQLQEKKKRKQNAPNKFDFDMGEVSEETPDNTRDERRLNSQPVGSAHDRVSKYSLVFGGESKEEIRHNTQLSKEPLPPVDEKLLESAIEDFMVDSIELGMPKRGNWDYAMSKNVLEKAEQKLFNEWTKKLDQYYKELGRVSYYERNLETWRQLWRTLERSDIVLFVCDIRYPTLHFSHAVYKYITEDLVKPVILVLNKVDMVHPKVSVSWKVYFEEKYPGMRVVLFSAYPQQQRLEENTGRGLLKKQPAQKAAWAYGAQSLIQLAKCYYEDKSEKDRRVPRVQGIPSQSSSYQGERCGEKEEEGEFVTIGLIGQPNAGKSSLINGLLEDKKVSVSRTPGHTKHFQTIFFSPDIRLCDCPGLVFPNSAPKQLQIASGMYPVAQVREPYSVVHYIAQRLDLVLFLKISHPDMTSQDDHEADKVLQEPQTRPWTAWYICFAWAEKNGLLTARTGRPDVYRGANSILRLVVTGRLCFRLLPPDFQPDKLMGSYQDIIKELISFATKNEEESEVESDESDSEDQLDTNEENVSCSNMFDMLQGNDD